MTYYDIYLSALAYIGEPEDSTGAADYKNRAALLLPHIVASLAHIHVLLGRKAVGDADACIISLDSLFPLDLRLAGATTLELASLLIIDELPELSQILAQRAKDERLNASAQACSVGSTREVY